MSSVLLAAAGGFVRPDIDWHALAPELVILATLVICLLIDVFTDEGSRWTASSFAGIGMLAAVVPLLTLHMRDADAGVMFGGGYVVDDFSLVLKGLFLVAGYITVLISTNQIAEGDYPEGEYYQLLLAAVFGMMVMSSSRDLITIFVAFEMLSIPTYLLAAWRKRTQTGIEAGMKYYLMGVFATGVMLYGMSLIFGGTGTTLISEIGVQVAGSFGQKPVAVLGIIFTLVGFAFKVSAVPFQNWAPDTYEGAPTPVTTFLAVASKAAGFVALISLVFYAFLPRADIIEPLFFVLAIGSMTVGNLAALRQTNVVRMLAYSGIAHAGFMLAPFVVAGSNPFRSMQSIVVYLVIYAAMNLGAFACVIAMARQTRSAELKDLAGVVRSMPGLAWCMVLFLASLIGMPPLGGWYAKFGVFKVVVGAETGLGYATAIIMAINTAIAAYYYLNVAKTMIFDDPPEGAPVRAPRTPPSLTAAIAISMVATFAFGILPGLLTNVTSYGPLALGG